MSADERKLNLVTHDADDEVLVFTDEELAQIPTWGGVTETELRLAAEVRSWRDATKYVRSFYDESIFPPRPQGPHSEVYDAEAASVARLVCDNILREALAGRRVLGV